jgi:hypothetical protein
MKRCLLVLADGARPDVLAELAARGELPHLTRHVLEPGCARDAVTVFPSTTGPAHLPYLTGLFPGSCDIPGIRWFDAEAFEAKRFSLSRFRSYVGPGVYLFDRDLRRDVRSLFHYARDHANVFGNCTRGLRWTRHRTRFAKLRLNLFSFFSNAYGRTDRECAEVLAANAHRSFVFAVLPGIDSESHKSGVRAPGTLDAYRRLDDAVGRVAARLGSRLADETLLLIVSDHGLTDTGAHFDLEEALSREVGRVLAYPRLRGALRGARGACMVSGNAMAHVHFRGSEGWGDEQRAREMARRLIDEPEVDVVAWREEGAVHAASRRGEARMKLDGDRLRYEALTRDPFGYPALPAELSSREALQLTAPTRYPDAPVQVAQLFRSGRTGDLVVTAAPGFDLRARFERPPHRGSHGALYREHMSVPLWCNRRLPEGPHRSVDVFASVLEALGLSPPVDIDGEPFAVDSGTDVAQAPPARW